MEVIFPTSPYYLTRLFSLGLVFNKVIFPTSQYFLARFVTLGLVLNKVIIPTSTINLDLCKATQIGVCTGTLLP
jgi:hypothetical protein